MIFLKKFFIVTAALAVAAGCTACNSKDSGNEQTTTATTQTVVTTFETVKEAASMSETTTAVTTEPASKPPEHVLKPEAGKLIYDEAGVLDEAAKQEITAKAEELYKNRLINAAVITVSNIGGQDPLAYAQEAYNDIYEGRGSGLLYLINNDTGNDILYLTGRCRTSVSEDTEKDAMYWATREIVSGDYKAAVGRMFALAENSSQHVFDNAGIFSEDVTAELEAKLNSGANDLSLLATANTTGKPNTEILTQYYSRRYQDGSGYMILLDTESKSLSVHSGKPLPADIETVLKNANALAAKGDYSGAVGAVADSLKG